MQQGFNVSKYWETLLHGLKKKRYKYNKDKNFHRFALSATKERARETEKRAREQNIIKCDKKKCDLR